MWCLVTVRVSGGECMCACGCACCLPVIVRWCCRNVPSCVAIRAGAGSKRGRGGRPDGPVVGSDPRTCEDVGQGSWAFWISQPGYHCLARVPPPVLRSLLWVQSVSDQCLRRWSQTPLCEHTFTTSVKSEHNPFLPLEHP